MSIPNVLANRYASQRMREIWSPEAKIVAERRLWLAVLQAQADLGVDFGGDDPSAVIADYSRRLHLAGIIDRVCPIRDVAAASRVPSGDQCGEVG